MSGEEQVGKKEHLCQTPQATEDKMTKEDVVVSAEGENVVATEEESNKSNESNKSTNAVEENNGAELKNSPQPNNSPPEIQNNEDAADTEELELIRRMRADAVDNTMYSKKFILQTLVGLSQQAEQAPLDDELEEDLCKLWDISVAPEVVSFLLQNETIELIAIAITNSEDLRLYEILIGMLGNMCAQLECVEQLTINAAWVEMLLKMTTCMDTCMLIQLMRLYQHVMTHVVSGKEQLAIDWYTCFAACDSSAKNIGFILQQSVSEDLLVAALKAINSILASCAMVEEENAQSGLNLRPFAEVFLVQELCDGINDAFMRLMRDDLAKQADEVGAEAAEPPQPQQQPDDEDNESNSPKITCDIEIIQTYLNICTILVQLPEAQYFMDAYASSIMYCLTRILKFLQQPTQLLPLGERQEEYLEDLAHICSCLKYFYDKHTFLNVLEVWLILRHHLENYEEYDEQDFEAYEDEPRSQYEENAFKLLRLLAHMLNQVDVDVITKDIEEVAANKVELFRTALQTDQEEDAVLQRAHERLSAILNNIAGQAK